VNDREATALAKLLKIARIRMDDAAVRVAALEASLAQTEGSLRLLADAVAGEEAAAKAAEVVGFAQLAGFLAGAERKRAALEATRAQIRAEIGAARSELEAAFVETCKLDHLVARAQLAAQKYARRAETLALNEAASAGFRRADVR
jgi:flagellar export protein FliJ